jgi:protein disulfide-isomerase-like protein
MKNPNEPIKYDAKQDWLDISGHENIAYLDDSNFDNFIKQNKKVMVFLYAPWCGHCKTMKPAYAEAATEIKAISKESHLAAVDATKAAKLSKRFEITGFPTIKYFE